MIRKPRQHARSAARIARNAGAAVMHRNQVSKTRTKGPAHGNPTTNPGVALHGPSRHV
jgi:hypothetical protein